MEMELETVPRSLSMRTPPQHLTSPAKTERFNGVFAPATPQRALLIENLRKANKAYNCNTATARARRQKGWLGKLQVSIPNFRAAACDRVYTRVFDSPMTRLAPFACNGVGDRWARRG